MQRINESLESLDRFASDSRIFSIQRLQVQKAVY